MSTAHRLRIMILLAMLGLVSAALTPALASARPTSPTKPAATTTATHIAFGSIDTPAFAQAPVTPGAPAHLVVRRTDFTVTASFLDVSEQPAVLSTNKTVTVNLDAVDGSGAHARLASRDVPAGQASVTFTGAQIATAGNHVHLELSTVARKAADVVTGSSSPFDVLKSALVTGKSSALTGIGSGGGVGTACEPTPQDPVCGDLLLSDPSRVTSDNLLLSLGVCGQFIACDGAGSVVQVLVGLSQDTSGQPAATMVMKCDKSLCGGGGVPAFHLLVDLTYAGSPTSDFAPPCPAKGTIGADQDFCVDYAQSTRANAGDLYLYLLLDQDARVRFP